MNTIMMILWAVGVVFLLSGIRIIRPNERATIERLGRYKGQTGEGFNWIIPIIDRIVRQNTQETMMDVESFEAITKERLNTQITLVVFYKVKEDDKSIYKSLYKVKDFERQVVRIAQTTARNIIGQMNFEKVNSERDTLNKKLKDTLEKQSDAWGVEIVRVETKEITPPEDVQDSMNTVLIAENNKTAAVNNATAKETEADGLKRAKIKEAEGIAKGRMIVADANAYQIKIENQAAQKFFTGNALKLKQLETAQESLKNNAKIVLGADSKGILKLFDLNK